MNIFDIKHLATKFLFISSMVVFSLFVSVASAGPFGGWHNVHNPMEKMLDHIDLSDEQEQEIEKIFSLHTGKKSGRFNEGFQVMRDLVALNPDAPDYSQLSEQHADLASEKVREKILSMARMRKEIYAVLNEEQKQELKKVLDRKMARMAKRMK